MDFSTIVVFMGIFYLMVFLISYVENALESRRARSRSRHPAPALFATYTAPNNGSKGGPNDLPRRNTTSAGICSQEGGSNQCQIKITRVSIQTSTRDDNSPASAWPPNEAHGTSLQCSLRGNRWICSPVETVQRINAQDLWEDLSQENAPHCLHGEDKVDIPKAKRDKSKSKDSCEDSETSSHHKVE